ncbi:hypothetical protein U9M48_013722 [Paspalum notatum var. saurae]|uniref:Uncharacterized protein n=1 Tax=Paspalum notatum var. saurae TaxID=547442 RepID=A0AAQ3T0Y8_PASNO
MSSFKRGARMRVGGRIGRLDKTRLPTPTPPSPPPQGREDLNDTEEEDPEELVPDSSDEEQSEEPEVQPEVPPAVPEDQAAARGQDEGQVQQQQNEIEDRWNESIHHWSDYPLLFPRMLREALVRLRLGHAWVSMWELAIVTVSIKKSGQWPYRSAFWTSMEHVGTSPSATPLPFATTMKPPSVMQLRKPWRPYATLAIAC